MTLQYLAVLVVLVAVVPDATGSDGDRMMFYGKCLYECREQNCVVEKKAGIYLIVYF